MPLTVRLLDTCTRRYLDNVHRHPLGVAVEAAGAWIAAWLIREGL